MKRKSLIGKGKIGILHFSSFRAPQDVSLYERSGRAVVYEMPSKFIVFINAIVAPEMSDSETMRDIYYSEEKKYIELRRVLVSRLGWFVRVITKVLGVSAIVSPAAHYRQEKLWAYACEEIGFPFISVHKEMTSVPQRHKEIKAIAKGASGSKWHGSIVCVANETAKEIAIKANLIDESKLVLSGLIRSDDLIGPLSSPPPDVHSLPKVITLFSFAHYTGAFLEVKAQRSKYFCKDDSHGFVKLFNVVHAAAAQFAIEHPDTIVFVKPKLTDVNWISEITRAVREGCGVDVVDIPNFRITSKPAPELIDGSRAIVALNSSVVLEGRLRGRPTILPIFEEAEGSHEDALFFRGYYDLFNLAHSKEELLEIMQIGSENKLAVVGSDKRVQEMCEHYFGFSDGMTTHRILDIIKTKKS
ncbi:hypothetical protein M9H61_17555 [Thalassospira sp. GO-4]|uniref:hypothetical protein n=1 Tax=Thalassospira sp. GO-4 TaxID=2946605 RepID=UPI002023D4DF|nr:hypothetical protein [Thalassospira sp. GO-4]URK17339.1 hypothetical protein M9H61_17555 [Thalassospira sp. GO-4]